MNNVMKVSPLYRFTHGIISDYRTRNGKAKTDALLDDLNARYLEATTRRDTLTKASFVLTLLLFTVVSGAEVVLPIWGINLKSIPGFVTLLLALQNISIATMCLTFSTALTYSQLMSEIINKDDKDDYADNKLISFSKYYNDLTMYVFNQTVVLGKDDILEPQKMLKSVINIFWLTITVLTLSILLMYIFVMGYCIYVIAFGSHSVLLTIFSSCVMVFSHVVAIISCSVITKEFACKYNPPPTVVSGG